MVYERYFDNSAAELFCKKRSFKKDKNLKVLNTEQSSKTNVIPVKLPVYLQCNILIVVAVQYHLCNIFCCLINISQTHEIIRFLVFYILHEKIMSVSKLMSP